MVTLYIKFSAMKKTFLLLSGCFIITISLYAQSKDEVAIRTALDESIIAWNKGDLHGFMNIYWQSDSMTFISNNGITYGWQNTLNDYKKGYPDTTAMGKLQFEILNVKRISTLYFFIVGKWKLDRSIGNTEGVFSLIFRKVKKKWVIVADHSN